MIDLYSEALQSYAINLMKWLPKPAQARLRKHQKTYTASGLNKDASLQLSQLEFIHYGLDIASAAKRHQHSVAEAGKLWFALYEHFQADWLCQAINALPSADAWQRKARNSLKKELETTLTSLTAKVLQCASLADWQEQQHIALTRLGGLFDELHNSQDLDLAKLSVAVGAITNLQHESYTVNPG
jgi:glutamate dehydrogenase